MNELEWAFFYGDYSELHKVIRELEIDWDWEGE